VSTNVWDPRQYNCFADEREQPFWDLAALLAPAAHPNMVDLGCGDGRLTAALHHHVGAAATLGIDSSDAMLADAEQHAGGGVTFERGDIATWSAPGAYDIVFSNAAMHWAPDHEAVLARWTAALRPGGQLAVQVPSNADHPAPMIAAEVAAELLGPDAPPDVAGANVLRPEDYARVLDRFGYERQSVRLQVYGHHLDSTSAVVDWIKGSTLTRFRALLPGDAFDVYVEQVRVRVVAALGEHAPFFYPFKRILLWGQRP